MADALITTDGAVTAIVPEIWSSDFYKENRENLPFRDSVSNDWEGEVVRELGDTVRIPTLPDGSIANIVAEGAKNDAVLETATTQSLVINKRAAKDFIITREADLFSIPIMDGYKDNAIFAIMRQVEQQIIDELVPVVANQLSYDTVNTLGKIDLRSAKDKLDAANVAREGRSLISGSDQANDLLDIPELVDKDFNGGDSPSIDGAVTRAVFGFMPKSTTRVGNTSFLFHRSALQIAFAEQLNITLDSQRVNGVRATRLNVDLLFGVKLTDGDRVVTID